MLVRKNKSTNMKQILTKALLASASVALFAQGAYANTAFPNEDVVLSFRESGDPDLQINLGSVSTFLTTQSDINLSSIVASYGGSYTTVSSLIDQVFGSASGVTWAASAYNVDGSGNTDAVWTTNPGANSPALNEASLGSASGYISSYAGKLASAATGTPGILISTGSGSSRTVYAASSANTLSGGYTSDYSHLRSTLGFSSESTIGSTGSTSAAFYEFDPSVTGSQAPLDGTFVIGSDGSAFYDVTPVAAPEPAMYGVLAGFGLLALSLRHQLSRRQA
jgi:hypothetical protein